MKNNKNNEQQSITVKQNKTSIKNCEKQQQQINKHNKQM